MALLKQWICTQEDLKTNKFEKEGLETKIKLNTKPSFMKKARV